MLAHIKAGQITHLKGWGMHDMSLFFLKNKKPISSFSRNLSPPSAKFGRTTEGRPADSPPLAFSFSWSSYSCIAETQLLWISSPRRFRSATDLSTSSASRAMHSSLRRDKYGDTSGPRAYFSNVTWDYHLVSYKLAPAHFFIHSCIDHSRFLQKPSNNDWELTYSFSP